MSTQDCITIRDVKKSFASADNGSTLVLDIPELTIRKGEFFCVVGGSGSGKTTLLNLLTGFHRPDEGVITINGRPVTAPNPKYIQVFQEYGLFPWRTVYENIAFGLEVQHSSGKDAHDSKDVRAAVEKHIALVGLKGFEQYYPNELSGGMQQRVAIARALAVEPEVLFLDEPFGALDALTRLNMQQELVRIWSTTHKTIVFITHNIDEATYLGDRVAILSSEAKGVKKVVDITVARPRDPLDNRLLDVKKVLYEELSMGSQA